MLQKIKPLWICVFLILTLLGTSSGSRNTKKEAYWTNWTNWTWQNTLDLMIVSWMLNYCAIALYLTFQFTSETIRLTRLQHEIKREWLGQLELEHERAAQPKPWRPKPKKKRAKQRGEW